MSSDQQRLIINENDNPPTYQDATNQGANSYGAISIPSVTTNAPYNPYAFGSQQPPTVIIIGGCPTCKVGMLDTEFTCMGICCAICCFPIGILCCLGLRQRRCNFCGAIFD